MFVKEALLTPSDVAGVLSISKTTVHRLADRGQLPFIWVGGQRRFKVDDIERVVENGTTERKGRGRPRKLAL